MVQVFYSGTKCFSVKMYPQSRILFVHSLFCILICSTVALKCDKLHTIDNKAATEDRVFNEGVYHVKTTLQSKSGEMQELLVSMNGISNVKLRKRGFTATLQPKHIKKVSNICRHLLFNSELTKYPVVM